MKIKIFFTEWTPRGAGAAEVAMNEFINANPFVVFDRFKTAGSKYGCLIILEYHIMPH